MFDEKTNKIHPASGPHVIAVGGGKGGIGKSFLSSNLAFALSRHASVCIIDLDLGASNLHTCFGIKSVNNTLSEYLYSNLSLLDVIQTTPYPRLDFISGFHDNLEVAQINKHKVMKLQNDIQSLPYDYVILDLGAGSNFSTVSFFLSAHTSLIVTTPDPTSVENAYRFLKTAFYQKIRSLSAHTSVRQITSQIMSNRDQLQVKSPAHLLNQIQQTNSFTAKIIEKNLANLNIGIVLNQVRMKKEEKLGPGIARVCRQYFGISCQYLGAIKHDDTAWQSIRKCQLVLKSHPYENVSQQILSLAKILVGEKDKIAVI
tara:strand:+ start:21229 stop:22173 length:945 start_codon:yes stop_codon:yes gene_type:complete